MDFIDLVSILIVESGFDTVENEFSKVTATEGVRFSHCRGHVAEI
jgi:hypothetical protein